MMVARGELILYADADGATKFSDLEKVEAGLKKVATTTVQPLETHNMM